MVIQAKVWGRQSSVSMGTRQEVRAGCRQRKGSEPRESSQNSTFTVHLAKGTYCLSKGQFQSAPLNRSWQNRDPVARRLRTESSVVATKTNSTYQNIIFSRILFLSEFNFKPTFSTNCFHSTKHQKSKTLDNLEKNYCFVYTTPRQTYGFSWVQTTNSDIVL